MTSSRWEGTLLATQVLSQINEMFEIELPLVLLFDESITIRGLARGVTDVLAGKATGEPAGAHLDEERVESGAGGRV